jgi:hypothetical protein
MSGRKKFVCSELHDPLHASRRFVQRALEAKAELKRRSVLHRHF